MGKLKGMGFKQILLNHGEKLVLGSAGLLVLIALATTTWGGIAEKPQELLDKATTAQQRLHEGQWPPEKQADFKPSSYQQTAVDMFAELNMEGALSPYSFDKPMSWELYPRQEPRMEPEWPVVEKLVADADRMVLAVNTIPTFEEGTEEGVDPATGFPTSAMPENRLSKQAKGPMGGHAAASPMGMGEGAPGMMMSSGVGANSGVTPRGQRYVALRGIVNLYEIGKAIQKACNFETHAEAMQHIEVVDFKIERQRAVAGQNPWPEENWKEVKLDRADEILEECSQAADIVNSGVINPVFTMPLPSRMDRDYTDIVSHPLLSNFKLSREQREEEQKLNSAMLQAADEMGINPDQQVGKRRGFIKNQVDMNSTRSQLMGAGANMGELMKRAGVSAGGPGGGHGAPGMGMGMGMPNMGMGMGMPNMSMNRGAPQGMPNMGMGMAGRAGGHGAPAMASMQMSSGMGMGMGAMRGGFGGAGGEIGIEAVGYVMLFRFLDFDVNPGEAYRYRVQLEILNPNFGLQLNEVREAAVAEGETRMTNWSEPSAPVVVPQDTNVFLVKIDDKARTRGEAEVRMYQWDPRLGTYIDGKLSVKNGEFLGGLAETDRLNLGTPSLEKKPALFATKDFLVDTSLNMSIVPAEHPDLQLDNNPRTMNKPIDLGLPAEALVLNEYGEIVPLESKADPKLEAEQRKLVAEERKPWEQLREMAAATEANRLNATGMEGAMGSAMPMMGMPSNAAQRRGRGRAGAGGAMGPGMPGAMGPGMPGAMGPGAGRGRTKNKGAMGP